MNTNIQELSAFNKACDELVAGKYILVDVKINSILTAIETDEKIKNIVASCVNTFNFMDLLNNAMSTGSLIAPTEQKQVIALVYDFLYRFKNKEIDFYEFLNSYYPDENGTDAQFLNFATALILPFRQAVGDIFIKRHVIVESQDYQDNYYNKIKTTTRLILSNMDTFKLGTNDKEEYTMLLNSLYLASEKNDKSLVYSLMIAIDYFTKYHKKVRKTYLALEECFN